MKEKKNDTRRRYSQRLEPSGLKCDKCQDYMDMSVSFKNYQEYINKPCPKCGAPLLTEADYKVCKRIIRFVKVCNFPGIRHLLYLLCGSKRRRYKFEMNGTGTKPVKEAATSIMYQEAREASEQTLDEWHMLERKQALRDSLEAFKRTGVIADYNLKTGNITW